MGGTEGRPNPLSLLVSLVDRPATTLAEIATRPKWRWIVPVILLVGAIVTSTVLTQSLTAGQAQQAVEQQLSALPAAQAEMVRARVALFQQPEVLLAISIGAALLGLLLAWLVASAILYLSMLIGGGDVDFNGLFATLPWTWLPFALRDAVQTGWVLYRNRLIANQGLSYLVSTGKPLEDAGNVLYKVLSHVDLFTLWHLVLVFVVLCVLPRFSRGKAFVLTLVYAAASLGLRLLPALLGPSSLTAIMG